MCMSIYSTYLQCKGAKVFKSKWKYAFNWRTRQIDWEWAFDHPGEGLYQIGMPKVHGDYLAAADTGGQLHLFKKTS